MKKIRVSVIMILMLCMVLIGCGKENTAATNTSISAEENTKVEDNTKVEENIKVEDNKNETQDNKVESQEAWLVLAPPSDVTTDDVWTYTLGGWFNYLGDIELKEYQENIPDCFDWIFANINDMTVDYRPNKDIFRVTPTEGQRKYSRSSDMEKFYQEDMPINTTYYSELNLLHVYSNQLRSYSVYYENNEGFRNIVQPQDIVENLSQQLENPILKMMIYNGLSVYGCEAFKNYDYFYSHEMLKELSSKYGSASTQYFDCAELNFKLKFDGDYDKEKVIEIVKTNLEDEIYYSSVTGYEEYAFESTSKEFLESKKQELIDAVKAVYPTVQETNEGVSDSVFGINIIDPTYFILPLAYEQGLCVEVTDLVEIPSVQETEENTVETKEEPREQIEIAPVKEEEAFIDVDGIKIPLTATYEEVLKFAEDNNCNITNNSAPVEGVSKGMLEFRTTEWYFSFMFMKNEDNTANVIERVYFHDEDGVVNISGITSQTSLEELDKVLPVAYDYDSYKIYNLDEYLMVQKNRWG